MEGRGRRRDLPTVRGDAARELNYCCCSKCRYHSLREAKARVYLTILSNEEKKKQGKKSVRVLESLQLKHL